MSLAARRALNYKTPVAFIRASPEPGMVGWFEPEHSHAADLRIDAGEDDERRRPPGPPPVKVTETGIPDVKILTLRRFGDERGFFCEIYNKEAFAQAGIDVAFVQDNHSLSHEVGVVRGLHFQRPPLAQVKLIRVIRGAIFDVALDLRRDSPTFGRHVSQLVSAADWNQIYIPAGFAHGFCTLKPDTEVVYKVSARYAPDHEGGILWNDPELAIAWPAVAAAAVVSDKDRRLPPLGDIAADLPF